MFSQSTGQNCPGIVEGLWKGAGDSTRSRYYKAAESRDCVS